MSEKKRVVSIDAVGARGKVVAKISRRTVTSVGIGEHVYIPCPKCDTICSLVLRKNGMLEWACGTLDCGFTKRAL